MLNVNKEKEEAIFIENKKAFKSSYKSVMDSVSDMKKSLSSVLIKETTNNK